jgi:hypothetical protein
LVVLLVALPLAQCEGAGIQMTTDGADQTTARHDLPIAVSLLAGEVQGSSGLFTISAEADRLAYDGDASLQISVEPETAAEIIEGAERVAMPYDVHTSCEWKLLVSEGARVFVKALAPGGSLLGGNVIDVAGGLAAPNRIDTIGSLRASIARLDSSAAPAAAIDVTYSLCYQGQSGSGTYPCRYAYYELWRNDGAETRVATGYADANGRVSFSGISSGNLDLRFWSNDGTSCSVDDGMSIYSWSSDYQSIVASCDLTVTCDDALRGVWAAYSNVQDAYYWLKGETGWSRSAIIVSYPYENWPHSHGNLIHMVDAGGYTIWDKGVIMHEYAHCVQYVLPGGWPPGQGPSPHYITSESSAGFALLEGWAEFFPAAVMDDSDYFFGTDLETFAFADAQTSGNWDGNIVEGAMAALMWDIYDGVSLSDLRSYDISSYGDRVNSQFATFWNIFSTKQPKGMTDIWANWPGKGPAMWAIYYYQRSNVDAANPANPSAATPDQAVTTWTDGMEVTVRLTGASDDASGIWGYSYIWSSAPADPTGKGFSQDANLTTTLETGKRVLSVMAKDRSGRSAATYASFTFYNDNTSPSNPTSVTSDHTTSVWSSDGGIRMSWSGASDSSSGVRGYSILFDHAASTTPDTTMDTAALSYSTDLSDGIWYFHIRAVDNAGNWAPAAVHSGPYWIDDTAPIISATMTGPLGLNGIFTGNVTIAIDVTDALSGLDGIQFRDREGQWALTSGDVTITGDGEHDVDIMVQDQAGNTAYRSSITFKIDTTAPAIPLGYSSSVEPWIWSNSDALEINWESAQDASGILGYSILVTRDASAVPDATVDQSSLSLLVETTPGEWYVNIRSIDNAGLASACMLSIGPFLIDQEAPVTEAGFAPPLENGWYQTNVSVSLSATDELSGIARVEARIDGGDWHEVIEPILILEGRRTLEFRAIDYAGNVEGASSLVFQVDVTSPAAPAALSSSMPADIWTNGTLTQITWAEVIDGTSGTAAYLIRVVDAGGAVVSEIMQTGTSFTAKLPDGIWEVRIWSVDWAGNLSPEPLVFGPFAIDTASPGPVLFQVVGMAGDPGWYRSGISVVLSSSDDRSGLASYEVETGDGVWRAGTSPLPLDTEGRHSIRARAVDLAGNRGPAAVLATTIDLTAPSVIASIDAQPVSSWFDGPVQVTLQPQDNLGSGAVYLQLDDGSWQQGTQLLVGEGRHVLRYYAVDEAGNIGPTEQQNIDVDAIGPELAIPGEQGHTVDSEAVPLRLHASASDALSGLRSVEFSFRYGEGLWTGLLPADGSSGADHWLDVPANSWMAHIGSQLIFKVCATDNAGNGIESESSAISLLDDDVSPPEEPTVQFGPDCSVLFHSHDASGWEMTVRYAFSPAPDRILNMGLQPNGTGSVTFALPRDILLQHLGQQIILSLELMDLDADRPGDSSMIMPVWQVTINITDDTPPQSVLSIDGPANGQWYISGPAITLSATDDLSGLHAIWCRIDDEEWAVYNGTLGLPDGRHTLLFRAEDNQGNLEEVQSVEVFVDTTAPQGISAFSSATSNGIWRNSPCYFSVNTTDAVSGIDRVEYSLDGGTWIPYSGQIWFEEGMHDLYYRAFDRAGNMLAPVNVQVYVDTGAPVLRLQAFLNGTVFVNASAADAMSGLSSLTLKIDGVARQLPLGGLSQEALDLGPGAHVLTLSANDSAGNQAVSSIEVVVPASVADSTPLLAAMAAILLIAVVAIVLVRRRKG